MMVTLICCHLCRPFVYYYDNGDRKIGIWSGHGCLTMDNG